MLSRLQIKMFTYSKIAIVMCVIGFARESVCDKWIAQNGARVYDNEVEPEKTTHGCALCSKNIMALLLIHEKTISSHYE